MQNLLHAPIGNDFPNIINTIIEIPKDTNAKYEYDIILGLLVLNRCLISSMRYPASYGFVPQTIGDDGDPLDILVYNTVPIQSLSMVEVRPIGALHMVDNGIDDYKIIGIPTYNPHNYSSLAEIDSTFLQVVSDFFKHYKNNDSKKGSGVVVNDWVGSDFTCKIIQKANQTYLKNYNLNLIKDECKKPLLNG